MTEPLNDSTLSALILERAVEAYQQGVESRDAEALRHAGALFCFHGLAENGGLVGGAIENCFHSADTLVSDALLAYRWFGLNEVADLIARGDREYRRFRPTGWEELSAEDEVLWDELDDRYFEIADDNAVEAALKSRADQFLL